MPRVGFKPGLYKNWIETRMVKLPLYKYTKSRIETRLGQGCIVYPHLVVNYDFSYFSR